MSKKSAHIKIEELKSNFAVIKNLEVSIGRIVEEKAWKESRIPDPTSLQRMIREKKE